MRNFQEYASFISKYNSLGLDFYNNPEISRIEISNILSIDYKLLDFHEDGIFLIDEKLFDDIVHNSAKCKDLFDKLSVHILLYIYETQIKKFNRKRAFIDVDGKYCPVLTDKRNRIDLSFMLYFNFTFKNFEKYLFTQLFSNFIEKTKSFKYWYSEFEFEKKVVLILVDK